MPQVQQQVSQNKSTVVAPPAPAPVRQVSNQDRQQQLRQQTRDADYQAFLAQEKKEHSNGNHMSFLDRGWKGSRYGTEHGKIPGRIQQGPDGQKETWAPGKSNNGRQATAMPERGQRPEEVGGMDWLHGDITNASVAVGTMEDGEMKARWYGKNDQQNDQFWSATKHVQAMGVISLVNSKRPDLDIDTLFIREAGNPGSAMNLHEALRKIVSYDAGTDASNGLAASLGRVQGAGREGNIEKNTGHDVEFRGGYGAVYFQRPEIVTAGGEVVATAPAVQPAGQNMVAAYDLTRMMSMAAWHTRLEPEKRLPGAQWQSLESLLRAMGQDSARYVDAAIDRLGVKDQLENVVIATKLGHGIRSATGKAETVYTGMVEFTDKRSQPSRRRSVIFTLRGVKKDPVELDARMAAEVTELMRRVLEGSL